MGAEDGAFASEHRTQVGTQSLEGKHADPKWNTTQRQKGGVHLKHLAQPFLGNGVVSSRVPSASLAEGSVYCLPIA